MVILVSNSSERIALLEFEKKSFSKFCNEGPFSLDGTHIQSTLVFYTHFLKCLYWCTNVNVYGRFHHFSIK